MEDFSFREINWSRAETSVGEDHKATPFLESIRDTCTYLFQDIQKPTRYRNDNIPNVLALKFSNEEYMVCNMNYLPGLGT